MEFIGYIAALLTTISFIPQALKVIKTRNTGSISLMMYLVLTVGLMLWITYGFIKDDPPIIIANSITVIFALLILYNKIKFDILKK